MERRIGQPPQGQHRPGQSISSGRLVPLRPRAERVDSALLDRLTARLQGRGWVPRKQLRAELGCSDDALRAAARYSDGAVIGSSTHGYGLVLEVPVADVHRWIAESRSRQSEINKRVGEVFRVLSGRMRREGDRGAA